MQVDEEPEDLENTQVTESGLKTWKENNVAKEMLTRCTEEAASTATLEMKEASIKATMDMKDMTSRLMQDAADSDQRLAERDQRVLEQLGGMVRGVSDSLEGRLSDLETRMQNQWTVIEKRWMEKIVEPDDREDVVSQSEHRIRVAVQKDVDEKWRSRMEREDKITKNNIETPRSGVVRLRAKLTEEVVCMKNRHQGSAASTVAASTGGSGSAGNFATRVMQNTFVASQVELKGWGAWRNI